MNLGGFQCSECWNYFDPLARQYAGGVCGACYYNQRHPTFCEKCGRKVPFLIDGFCDDCHPREYDPDEIDHDIPF